MSASVPGSIRSTLPAVLAALAIGVFLFVCVAAAQSEGAGEGEKPAPAASGGTAYVDFLSILKDDYLLRRKQQELADQLQSSTFELEQAFEPQIAEQRRIRAEKVPSAREYRQAMREQLSLETRLYEEKLMLEQLAQQEIKNFGIERFKALRSLVRDIAIENGYSVAMNFVREPEKIEGVEDFQALQQQLLVSPVLHFDVRHDITDKVKAKADELWREHISLADIVVTDSKGAAVVVKEEEVPDAKDKDGKPVMRRVVELRLGNVYQLAVSVKDRGNDLAAGSPRAVVRWIRTGTGTGTVDDVGRFTTPAEWPKDEREFVIRARSAIDPTISRDVFVRLVDKDGKPRPAK